jgi:hypothetical protein
MKVNMSTDEFNKIYDQAISFWPDSILIKSRVFYENGGVDILELNTIHDYVEKKILETQNDSLRFMDWAIFTQLHEIAKYLDVIRPCELNRETVRKIFDENNKTKGSKRGR